ncbi:hypothetical protein TNCT_663281 [Trichonephila clavata]|uniref:Uncharacterized protein n=1 Tax=Trichonephila clavata TaxID=2740835 RepID=A0A8X6FBI2_TRICU|nr:hypothetical protein TNCT_663281 [Trichonephila clavata]
MKRMANPPNMPSKRVCFNNDAKLDSSFSDNAVPLHHFHLGKDINAAVTYFASSVQVHLRQYGRDENNRLYSTKKRCLYVACALAIPCKSNRANQRALLLNRRDLCSERRFDDFDWVHRGRFTYYLPAILQTEGLF